MMGFNRPERGEGDEIVLVIGGRVDRVGRFICYAPVRLRGIFVDTSKRCANSILFPLLATVCYNGTYCKVLAIVGAQAVRSIRT